MNPTLEAQTREMYARYQAGATLEELGRSYGFHTCTILARFQRLSLPRRTHQEHRRVGALKRRAKLDGLVAEMHREYETGVSLHALGRKYGRDRRSIGGLFAKRGYSVRACTPPSSGRSASGQILPLRALSAEEIDVLIARLKRLIVPKELKHEWRSWPLEKRAWFIERARAHLKRPFDRPAKPFSSNVEPFDYTTPRAIAIAAEENAGRPSRLKRVMIRISSQGVIYRDRLYFWACDREGLGSGAYYIGPWRPGTGRPALHQLIWQEHHSRKIPAAHVIRYADGNPNNLLPENLILATRNDVARENQANHLLKKSRELTSILLKRSQSKSRHDLSDRLLASSR